MKLLILGLLILVAASAASGQLNRRMQKFQLNATIGDLAAQLQNNCDQINYISETDSDVNVFVVGRGIATLDTGNFLLANPFLFYNNIPVTDENNFETRMAILETQNPAWDAIRTIMETHLTDLTVFKVGTIHREVYICGLFEGRIVGVKAYVLET